MGTCEVCNKYGETTRVTIENRSTGSKQESDLCPECALKGAAVVKAMGGTVIVRDGSRSSSGGGAGWVVALLVVAVIGIVIYFIAK